MIKAKRLVLLDQGNEWPIKEGLTVTTDRNEISASIAYPNNHDFN